MKADLRAVRSGEHFDGCLEQDYGGGAVDVVIAVEEDRFAAGDGQFKPVGSGCHSRHEEGVVEMADLRIEKVLCSFRGGDSAAYEQICHDLRNVRCGGEDSCFLRVRRGDLPALRGRGKDWLNRHRNRDDR